MRRVLQDHAAAWQARVPELTKPQFAILNVIARDPGVDQVTAGERAAIDKSTLAAMLRRLEERGLVTRSGDLQDRRRQRLELTEDGTAALHAAMPLVLESRSGCCPGCPPPSGSGWPPCCTNSALVDGSRSFAYTATVSGVAPARRECAAPARRPTHHV
ncbi:MarR family winged helix-turn-helix transcriptional regulator [Lentzea sp. E54]|uniref:MarR family winged helix-turn-helix transcriptional regulator n=1 Tax=Lentzea xerophila TaxID=3435883 RepID=UPI003DA326DC